MKYDFLSKDNIKKFLVYLLTFYFFYQPDLTIISPYLKSSIILVILDILCLYILRDKIKQYLFSNKKFSIVLGLMCIFSLFTVIQTLISKTGLMSNFTSIAVCLKMLLMICIFIWVDSLYTTFKEKLVFLINIGLIQALLSISMLVIPPLKNIANALYIQTVPDYYNSPQLGVIYVRIYGIFGDYTFSGAIFMAFLATISLYFYSIYRDRYFLISSILIIFASILNGRTGFYLYIICTIILLIKNLKIKLIGKKQIICVLCFLFLVGSMVYIFRNTSQVQWFSQGAQEVLSLFSGKKEGTFDTLINDFIFFPKGIHLLIGYGSRVYGSYGGNLIGKGSDIGYINDIFRGGILFIILYYGAIAKLLHIVYTNIKEKFSSKNGLILVGILSLFLFVSNFKGESLGTSSILFLFIYLVGISLSLQKIDKED